MTTGYRAGALAVIVLCGVVFAPRESRLVTLDELKGAIASNPLAHEAMTAVTVVGSPLQAHVTTKKAKDFPLDGPSYLIISGGDAKNIVPGVGSGNGNTSTGPCVPDAQFQTLCNVGGLDIQFAIPPGAQTLEFDYLFFEWDYIPFEDPFRVYVTALGETTLIAQSTSSCDLGYYKGDAQFAYGLVRRHVVIDLLSYGGQTLTLRLQASDRFDNLLNSGALVDKLVLGPATGEEMNIACPGLDPDDADADNVPDSIDNCPTVANPSQADQNNNGIGDACDNDASPSGCMVPLGDINQDQKVDVGDVQCTILVSLWSLGQISGLPPDCALPSVDVTDINCSGTTDVQDLQLCILLVLNAPLDASIDADNNLCPDACER